MKKLKWLFISIFLLGNTFVPGWIPEATAATQPILIPQNGKSDLTSNETGPTSLKLGFYNYLNNFQKACQWAIYNKTPEAIYIDYPSSHYLFNQTIYDEEGNIGYMIRPYWATWIGDKIIMAAVMEDTRSLGTLISGFFGYLSYEPYTQTVKIIGSGNISDRNITFGADATYDPTSSKLYLIGEDRYALYTNNCSDTVFEKVGNLSCPSDPHFGGLIALACNSSGNIYGIDQKGNFYKVDKHTAVATFINKTNCQVSSFSGMTLPYDVRFSATFDVATNNFWFVDQYVKDNAFSANLYKIDTLTGESECVDYYGFKNLSVSGIFDYTYLFNVPFSAVNDLKLEISDKEKSSISISFTHPALDIQGESIQKISKAYILARKSSDTIWTRLDSINNPVPGQPFNKEYSNFMADSTYVIGIYHTLDGIRKNPIVEKNITCTYIPIPYTHGFEDGEPIDYSVRLRQWQTGTAEEKAYRVKDSDSAATGEYAFRMSPGADLVFKAFPIEKGAVYEVRADVMSHSSDFYEGLNVVFESDDTYSETKNPIKTPGIYENISLAEYLAPYSGQTNFYFYNNTQSWENQYYYIDNISFKKKWPHTIPNIVNNLNIEADSTMQFSVNMSFTNPATDMAGNELESLDGVIVEYSNSQYFNVSAIYTDTILTTDIGEKIDIKLHLDSIKKAGYVYFRLYTFNQFGKCIQYATLDQNEGVFVGPDSRPDKVKNIRHSEIGDEIEITWDPVRHGSMGGWIGDVEYLVMVDREDKTDSIRTEETSYRIKGLPFGMQTIRIMAINKENNMTPFSPTYYAFVYLQQKPEKIIYAGTTDPDGSKNFPIFHYPGYSYSSMSQFLYTESMGIPALIDSLHFFIRPIQINLKKHIKVFLGASPLTQYSNTNQSLTGNDLKLVFDDTLNIQAGQKTITIPIDGYFYAGTTPLAIHISTPLSYCEGNYNDMLYFYSENTGLSRGLTISHSKTSFDSVGSFAQGQLESYVPTMVVSSRESVSEIHGTIKDKLNGTGIGSATLSLKKTGNKPPYYENKVITNEQGEYSFTHIPEGNYTLEISAVGYGEITKNWKIVHEENIVFDTVLDPASKINFSGYILDAEQNPIADVEMQLFNEKLGLDYSTRTDSKGYYVFQDIYGLAEYTLLASKKHLQSISLSCQTGSADTLLKAIVMSPIPYPVGLLQANKIKEDVTLSWMEPLSFLEAKWFDYESDTILYRMSYSSGMPFKVAIRFDTTDLREMRLAGSEILSFGFIPTDETANYSIVLCQGVNAATEIFREDIEDANLKINEMNRFEVSAGLKVNPSQELWAIVEVAQGYKGLPIGMGNTPAFPMKGDLIWSNGRWVRISSGTTMKGNLMISLYMKNDDDTQYPSGGYWIYRGTRDMDWNQYTRLNETPVYETRFLDTEVKDLNPGYYRYAVCTDWLHDNVSDPVFSNTLDIKMQVDLQVIVRTNGVSPEGATLSMTNTTETGHDYQAQANADGIIELTDVWLGNYDLQVELPYHESVVMKGVVVNQETKTITTDTLIEYISDPYIESTKIENNDILINWTIKNRNNWFDDMENLEDFAVDGLDPWIMGNIDSISQELGLTWPNMDKKQSFIVFNTNKVEGWPSVLGALSGEKVLAAFSAKDGKNDNYLIRGVEKGGGKLSFSVKAIGMNETFSIMYSPISENDFLPVEGASFTQSGDDYAWVEYTVDIPDDAKFIAFKYTSSGQQGIMLDDVSYISEDIKEGNPIRYKLYLDEKLKDSVSAQDYSYRFTMVEKGKHKVGVQAVFATGESAIVQTEVEVNGTGNISLNKSQCLSIYPNPVDNLLHLEGPASKITIFDMAGIKVLEQRIPKASIKTDITVSSLTPGLYTVHILSDSGNLTVKKLIKL